MVGGRGCTQNGHEENVWYDENVSHLHLGGGYMGSTIVKTDLAKILTYKFYCM